MTTVEARGWLRNGCFFSRFLVQWLASERACRSLSTAFFWRLSVVGSACLALLMLPSDPSLVWLACVVVGQALWSSRFVLQWWSSERRGESHFPAEFWWVSRNLMLLQGSGAGRGRPGGEAGSVQHFAG